MTRHELQAYAQEARALRTYLGPMDPDGELSGLMLISALRRMEDLIEVCSVGGQGAEAPVWHPLDELPTSVQKAAGDEIAALMLILMSDLASSFVNGYAQPDTHIGALAVELALHEAIFVAELWDLDITSHQIRDLRDPLLIDDDHLSLYEDDRKLSKPRFRSLFESHFTYANGRNGLHPFVEPR